MKPLQTLLLGLAATALVLGWILATWLREGFQPVPLARSPEENRELLRLTGTTARLAGSTPLETPTAYSQAVYASTQDEDRPGAVVLVRADDLLSAITATRLQHMPVDAPMLLVTGSGVPEPTRRELERLHPEGVAMDHNVQAYLVGNIPDPVQREVEEMGLETRRIFAPDAVHLAEVLDEFIAVMESSHKDVVFIGSTAAPEYLLPAANWNAHAGDGLAWVTPEGVPASTRRLLERRWPEDPYIFLFGPPEVIPAEVAAELSRYGLVQRVPGASPQELAVRWAGYKDIGRRRAWWFGQDVRSVGWGIAEPGHNYILANPSDWREVVPTGVLSHMGKHAPLLLTNPDGTLPEVARSYLELVQPTRVHPSVQVFNYGWVAGQGVPAETQREMSRLLRVRWLEGTAELMGHIRGGERAGG